MNYLSKEGLERLENELEKRENLRPEMSRRILEAKEQGDLSENAEYQEARELQVASEERIQKLESILKSAKIIKPKKSDVVSLGSVVIIQKEDEKETHEYYIVGSEEANMLERKLSHLSPLGEAMMRKKKGDKFSFETPGGKMHYKINSVKYIKE